LSATEHAPQGLDREALRGVFTAHGVTPEQFELDLAAPVEELVAGLKVVWDDLDLTGHAVASVTVTLGAR
jgi:hypothetical protein